jgi:hypothetical protein
METDHRELKCVWDGPRFRVWIICPVQLSPCFSLLQDRKKASIALSSQQLQRSNRVIMPYSKHLNIISFRIADLRTNSLFLNGSGHLCVLFVNLLSNDTSFLGSGLATNQGGVSIEVLSNFLKGSVLGLDIVEPDKAEFETEPNALGI